MTQLSSMPSTLTPMRPRPLADLGRLLVRALRRETRRLDALFVNVALPVGIMVNFVYVFGGAVDTGSSGLPYVDFVVPAVLLMCAGYGAALTASTIAAEMNEGLIDRLRTLPIDAWVVPASHVLASLIRNLVAVGLASVVALGLGFRPVASLSGFGGVFALLVGYILALSLLAVVWGLFVRSTQAAEAFSFVVLFLPYVSDGFVPAESMPSLLRGFAQHQPVTPLVNSMRALLLGYPLDGSEWAAAAWIGGIVLIALPLAGLLFRRRITA